MAPGLPRLLPSSPVFGRSLSFSLDCGSQVARCLFELPQAYLPPPCIYPSGVFDRERAQLAGGIPVELGTVSLEPALQCPYAIRALWVEYCRILMRGRLLRFPHDDLPSDRRNRQHVPTAIKAPNQLEAIQRFDGIHFLEVPEVDRHPLRSINTT